MIISILTLFPDMFAGPFDTSIIKRAITKNIITINYINIRDFATDAYKSVDHHPYGGGIGMILRVDVVDRAIQYATQQYTDKNTTIILLDPQGTPYKQKKAKQLATKYEHLVLVCGHYEGVDERIRSLVTEEVSIGDYILTGGEIPAMVIVDSITRLLPGTLTKSDATVNESFTTSLLEYPQYTKPEIYHDQSVPNVLLSGNHKKILEWKREQASIKTKQQRPDLIMAQKDLDELLL